VKRVLVADGLQAVGVDALRKHGLDVEVVGSLAERELGERIGEYEGLIVRSATKVTAPSSRRAGVSKSSDGPAPASTRSTWMPRPGAAWS